MRLLLLIAVLFSSLSVASEAHAQKRAIVLPAQLNGWFPAKKTLPAEIELNIKDRLRASRFDINKPELDPTEVLCFDKDCLGAILTKYNADIVIAPKLTNDEQQATTYFGSVLVAQLPEGKLAVTKHEKTCPNCSPAASREMLVELVGQSLAVPSKSGISDPPPPKKDAIRPALLGVGGALLGVTAISIGIGAWKVSQNNEVACGPICERTNTTPGIAASFAIAGITAIGGITAIVIAIKRKQ